MVGLVYPLESLMLKPGDINHLPGIVMSSLIHDSWRHLIYNLTCLSLLYFFLINGKQTVSPVLDSFILIIVSNMAVFLIGNESYLYLGASNLIYALVGYGLGSIVLQRKISFLIPIALLSGLLLTGLNFNDSRVSYLSHYLGALVGIGLYLYRFYGRKLLDYEQM